MDKQREAQEMTVNLAKVMESIIIRYSLEFGHQARIDITLQLSPVPHTYLVNSCFDSVELGREPSFGVSPPWV